MMRGSHGSVALVHDWLTGMRGGERVLEALAEIYPQAHLFTLFRAQGSVSPTIEALPVQTSFLQRVPGIRRWYRYWLPAFPAAAARLDLRGYPLVISSSHCAAKGVRTDPGAVHVCYCHTPMRYAWDRFDDYFGRAGGSRVPAPLARAVVGWLRDWDRRTAREVDRFLANSRFVAGRIQRYYGRTSEVIPPPVDLARFRPDPERADAGSYLLVAALVPYKRVDRALAAFRGSRRRLRIVGDGPDRVRLQRQAGEETTFLGRVSDGELAREYARCRALVVPWVEDAGIAPLEAMACGRPVVALADGGVPEVVRPLGEQGSPTGVLYRGEEPADLRAALERFECHPEAFQPEIVRRHAEGFSREIFRERVRAAIERALAARQVPGAQAS